MSEAVEAGDVDVVDLADVPYAPVLTASALKLALGLVLGLLLGLVLAYLLEALNTSIRRPEDLEAVLHVPGLAVIPRITGGVGQRPLAAPRRCSAPGKPERHEAGSLVSGAQTFSIGIEAFRNLRTSLIWSDGGEALKTLVVTSAAPGEGKTLTAANLAVTLAYDGLRVLLVDCDIRRPRVHGLFHAAPLAGAHGAADHLPFRSGEPVAPAGRDPNHLDRGAVGPAPAARCRRTPPTCSAAPACACCCRSCAEQFDIIVLDTPPVLATADAGIVASLTDGVLLVVRAGTDRPQRRPARPPAARQRGRARHRHRAE